MPLALCLFILGLAWSLAARGRRFRRAPLLAIATLSLVASADQAPPARQRPDHHTVGASAGGGQYMETCGGPRQYGSAGLHYAWTDTRGPHSSLGLSVDAAGGVDEEMPFFMIRPAFRGESRWLGGGLGLSAGMLANNGEYFDTFQTGHSAPLGLLPTAHLRLGPSDLFFVEGRFMDARPSPLPNPFVSLGLGFPIPSHGNPFERTTIRAGVSTSGFTLAPTIAFGEDWAIDLHGAIGDEHTYGFSVGLRKHLAARP